MGLTLNGADVSAWADQSGNAHHLLQAAPGQQPLWTAGAGISFTAANQDCLECTTGGLSGNFNHSIFVLARLDTARLAFAGWLAYGRSQSGGATSSVVGEQATPGRWYGGGDTIVTQGTSPASVNGTTYRVGKTHSGTTTQGYLNGATDGATGAVTYSFSANPGFIIGARQNAAQAGNCSNITVIEAVFCDAALGAPDIALLDAYFVALQGAL